MCPDSLALGQHSQCAQSLLSLAQLLCQSPSPNQNSNNASPTSSLPPSPTFAPFSFLAQILCCICVIFFLSLSQGPAQSHPPPPSPLNFHTLHKPCLSPSLVSATPSLHPTAARGSGADSFIPQGILLWKAAVHRSCLDSVCRETSRRLAGGDGSCNRRGQLINVSSVALSCLFWEI